MQEYFSIEKIKDHSIQVEKIEMLKSKEFCRETVAKMNRRL